MCVCVCGWVGGWVWMCIVLEFELRKAQETIKSLRGSLTEATGQYLAARLIHFSPLSLGQ